MTTNPKTEPRTIEDKTKTKTIPRTNKEDFDR